MKPTSQRAIILIVSLAICLTLGVLLCLYWLQTHLPDTNRLEYYKLYLEAVKVIGVGLLAILVPLIFTEARASFERLKESRIAYSHAKTGVDYLPLRLCTLKLKAAAALIQQVHVYKHQAELYVELEQHLRHKGIMLSRLDWWTGSMTSSSTCACYWRKQPVNGIT